MVEKKPTFDLDALEREGAKEPFVVQIGGERANFSDPQELDWQELVTMNTEDPHQFLRAVIAPDDQDKFFNAHMPAWKLNKLVEAYMAHYGMPMPGEVDASSGS